MTNYNFLIILISVSATFAYINQRFIKMPFVIGLFFLSTIVSLSIIIFGKLLMPASFETLKSIVTNANISKLILDIMLGFLLFAGSLHTDWVHIKRQIKQITLLAIGGVVISTIIISFLFFWLAMLLNVNIDFVYCLLFGALISPTDPIAVLGILTKANVPKKIETTIVGESLFNDGVGVVLFISILEIINSGSNDISFSHFGFLFLQEAVGGLVFGLLAGFILHHLLKSIDHYETEVLLTLAFVMLGYWAANMVHVSGPLAMVVMGMLVGNYNQKLAMSDITLEYVHKFWELVDVILNAILFILIALVLVVIDFKEQYILLGLASILIVLFSRSTVIFSLKFFIPKIIDYTSNEAKLMVWGGLRGGLSIALVLSIPDSETKSILLIATYFIVVFSILVRGLTLKRLVKRISPFTPTPPPPI